MSRSTHLPSRRTALLALLAAATTAACGGGGGAEAPTPNQTLALTPPPAPPLRLTLSGARMLTPGNVPIVLRGINEGTWGEMQQHDAADIAANGGKVVRVLIRWWGLYGSNSVESRVDAGAGHFDPAHLAQFLREVQWCIDAGLWVIPVIDSNCGQNGLQNPATVQHCDASGRFPGGHNFFTDLTQRALFKEAWVYLAGILKNYQRIAFYELLPEPLDSRPASYAPQLSSFYQELMTAIEDSAGDRRTPFLIGARDAYNMLLCDEAYIAAPRWANRVVYTGNLFIRTGQSEADNLANLDSRIGALVNLRTSRNVPVFIQQFGVRSGDDPTHSYLKAGLARMRAAAIGYTGWQWRQNTSNPDEYAIVLKDAAGNDVIKKPELALYAADWKQP